MQPATTNSVWDVLYKIGYWGAVAAIIVWILWRWLKKTDDPTLLVTKWLVSIPGIISFVCVIWYLDKRMDNGVDYGAAFISVLWTAATGIYFAAIWRSTISMILAKPLGAIYDGGTDEVDPQAYYSVAESKRRKGDFSGAVSDIRKQLEKFPGDFHGQMMLAEIQAENLNDLAAAEISIQRFCNQKDHAPRNIAYALNTLADWHLKLSVDPDAAREALQKIMQMLPGTEFALLAEQRIGHLATREHLMASHDRPRVALPKGVQNIGLMQSSAHLAPVAADEAKRAEELTAHLIAHPQDTDAREQLAVIYADHYQRLDMATDQLAQLIDQPNQPSRNVIRWLNKLADLQVRHGCDYDTVWKTLSQIIERYPNNAAADVARNRLDLLRLEMKVKDGARSVKLGDYEQNIGLKYGPGKGGVENHS